MPELRSPTRSRSGAREQDTVGFRVSSTMLIWSPGDKSSALGTGADLPTWWPALYRRWACRPLARQTGRTVDLLGDDRAWVLQMSPPAGGSDTHV